MTDMTISAPGLIEIAEHEGIVPAPYLDSAGVRTWGIGHTAAAGGSR
jgi:lysozyme